MSDLSFGQSWTIDQLKKEQTSSFKVIRKETGFWFQCGAVRGHVSDKIDLSTAKPHELLVSQVTVPDTGETFLMLHKQGSGEVAVEW